jgi:acetyl-CoA/propionyl-CoA/long-chain acyl-CoA carboxylase, biotin carboxylase, biotin carboxyl carrier protein
MGVLRTVLVANRGEIALRVMRTCRRLGIRTVAVFTGLDAAAPHVRAADDAVPVPSYLDIDALVAAADASGADAVHPGYGFLSERAPFAAALEAAGITFVGPGAAVMEQMGRKDAARSVAVAAGVPVVPHGEDAGLPVLVKAAAGGGGKGMRIVRTAAELDGAMAAARREAAAAFGDDTLLVEKYVEHGRHVEVQVIGDSHGSVLHLYERDCSPQRRHQKVLEESPAPTIDADLRHRMTTAAVDLARKVGYVNAGTVEFLLDPGQDGTEDQFYFLEMNTRLQVEHPVTELVTGLDLVELQLRVAAGEPLPITQEDVRLRGHAIEARVYAEDSFGGFLPQAGTASIVRWPETGDRRVSDSEPVGPRIEPLVRHRRVSDSEPVERRIEPFVRLRVDHALESGQVVSTAYDPMLGKVVAHGPDRESARRALVAALDDTAILGLTTNAGFVRALAAGDEFADAAIDTAWLDRHEIPAPDDELPRLLVAWVSAMLSAADTGHPFQADGFRLGGPPVPTIVGLDREVVVDRAAGTVDGVPVRQLSAEDHVLDAVVGGRRVRAVVNVQPHVVEVAWQGHRHVFTRPDVFGDHGPAAGDGTVVAPMPGTVLDVLVTAGQRVTAGAPLGAMEAMKMELVLRAPFDGLVKEVDAAVGQRAALGARLFVIEPEEAP